MNLDHPIIALDNVSYRRGENTILDRVNWRIEHGQHWTLLGANGAGKTTLLKIITGYEWPSQGRVEVLGEHFGSCNLRELRKSIGWVSYALGRQLPERHEALRIVLSGLDASIGTYRDYTADEVERAREALEIVQAGNKARQPYDTLSQGERQRVLIARALVRSPELLILDEPCVGLDPAARESFLADMAKLAHHPSGPTMILVTHHVEEVAPWIAHALVLRDGRVLAQGRTGAVLTGPILSATFDHPCTVEESDGRYHLRLESAGQDEEAAS